VTSASGVTVLELVNSLYMPALQCGIRPDDFWAMSVGELTDVIEAEMETRKQERKARISDAFVQAQAIAAYVMHEKNSPVPQPWDYYPELFKEDKEQYLENKKKAEIEEHKAQMREYARRLKEKRMRGGG